VSLAPQCHVRSATSQRRVQIYPGHYIKYLHGSRHGTQAAVTHLVMTKEQIQALNPGTAAVWIASGTGAPLSKAQHQIIVIACREGGYVQAGTGVHNGHVERVSAQALRALIRRGFFNYTFGSEGGTAGQFSERTLARLALVLNNEIPDSNVGC
jgi:hypothetical protein